MYERFLDKWFGVDPARERDHRPPDHPMVVVGSQVRAAREHASLTQRQVEDLTGIDQTVISRLENGKGSNMPLGRFAAMLIAIDAEIRPADRPLPAWMAPLLTRDDQLDGSSRCRAGRSSARKPTAWAQADSSSAQVARRRAPAHRPLSGAPADEPACASGGPHPDGNPFGSGAGRP